jgi:hypothetical protein
MTAATILWRRLDAPGHDVCRLTRHGAGWELSGTAVFAMQSVPTRVDYRVVVDAEWRTLHGSVSGWSGSTPIAAHFARTDGASWSMNGRLTDALADCVDLDFGFTPATNLLQLARLRLPIGERAEVPVAWFDLGSDELRRLPQTYRRLSDSKYAYEAPTVGYAAELEINASGFIRKYPGLWEEVESR